MKTFKLPFVLYFLVLISIKFIKSKPKDINLKDNDLSNTLYHSKRSHNLSYIYISNKLSQFTNYLVIKYLYYKTGIHFNSEINQKCLPINIYQGVSEIKPHKDRDMILNKNVDKICTITLEQTGHFTFNIYPKAVATNNGKTVSNLNLFHFIKTSSRTCLLIDNVVHGLQGEGLRYSLTYRAVS